MRSDSLPTQNDVDIDRTHGTLRMMADEVCTAAPGHQRVASPDLPLLVVNVIEPMLDAKGAVQRQRRVVWAIRWVGWRHSCQILTNGCTQLAYGAAQCQRRRQTPVHTRAWQVDQQ